MRLAAYSKAVNSRNGSLNCFTILTRIHSCCSDSSTILTSSTILASSTIFASSTIYTARLFVSAVTFTRITIFNRYEIRFRLEIQPNSTILVSSALLFRPSAVKGTATLSTPLRRSMPRLSSSILISISS